jgi:PAS domain S-box-containing protein
VVVDGPHPLAYVTFREVGGERAAARVLAESEQRFAAVFDRAPLAMALSRFPETTYVAANDAWRKLFEVGDVDVDGKTGVDLGIAEPEAWARTTEELRREGSLRSREVTRRTRTGQERTLLLSMEPLSVGGRRHVISIAVDLTGQRATEAALRECQERLRVALSELG